VPSVTLNEGCEFFPSHRCFIESQPFRNFPDELASIQFLSLDKVIGHIEVIFKIINCPLSGSANGLGNHGLF